MPQGPPELHEKWKDDANACIFLENAGYKLRRDWTWNPPSNNHIHTDEEISALTYLILEWDFGGVHDTIKDN